MIFTAMTILSSLILLVSVSLLMVITVCAVTNLIFAFGNNASMVMITEAVKERLSAGLALKEMALNTGRAAGMLFLLAMSGSLNRICYALIILSFIQAVGYLAFRASLPDENKITKKAGFSE